MYGIVPEIYTEDFLNQAVDLASTPKSTCSAVQNENSHQAYCKAIAGKTTTSKESNLNIAVGHSQIRTRQHRNPAKDQYCLRAMPQPLSLLNNLHKQSILTPRKVHEQQDPLSYAHSHCSCARTPFGPPRHVPPCITKDTLLNASTRAQGPRTLQDSRTTPAGP